jgi:hypothetical protein
VAQAHGVNANQVFKCLGDQVKSGHT